MTASVHPTAIVHGSAEFDTDVVVEQFAIVGPRVRIGAGSTIGPRATVERDTTIGAGCHLGVGAVVGADPQDTKYRGEPTTVMIGDGTQIREYVTINRGTAASGVTVVGSRCYLMSYAHVAHDCRIGNDVVLSNTVQLGGHVRIDDRAQIGGASAVHQFAHIGTFAFVGGGTRVARDVPPYTMTAGNPMKMYGINVKGLKRAGFDATIRLALKRAYRLLFNSSMPRGAAIERLRATSGHISEVMCLLDFVEESERSVLV